MMFRVKRLVVSGLISVMVTCLIVSEVSVGPCSEQLSEGGNREPLVLYCPSLSPGMSLNEPKVDLTVSEFTEPQGIGSEAEIRVTVTSRYDVRYVTVRIDLLKIASFCCSNATGCIEFIDGNTSRKWLVDLQANVSMFFIERIKAVDVGVRAIRASAAWWGSCDGHLGQDGLFVSVSEEEIIVTRKPLSTWQPPTWQPPMDVSTSSEFNVTLLIGVKFNGTPTVIPSVHIRNVTKLILEPNPVSGCHPPSEPSEIPTYLLINRFIPRAPLPPRPRLAIRLWISEFKPPGLGGEANLTVSITSNYDASNVTALIYLAGLELVIGDLTWSGELEANVPENFSVRVKASKFGCWNLKASVRWHLSPIQRFWGSRGLGIHVSKDGISTAKGLNHVMFPESCIYLEPAVIDWTADSHGINDTLTLQVRVTNVTDLAAIQFYMKWDPSVLRLLSVEGGDFLKRRRYTSLWMKSDKEIDLGYIFGGHCLFPIVSGVDITAPDSGLVATLTFQVINFTEGTEIHFANYCTYPELSGNFWIDCYQDWGLITYDFEFMLPAHFSFKNSTA